MVVGEEEDRYAAAAKTARNRETAVRASEDEGARRLRMLGRPDLKVRRLLRHGRAPIQHHDDTVFVSASSLSLAFSRRLGGE